MEKEKVNKQDFFTKRIITKRDKTYLFENLSVLLTSDIKIADSISILKVQTTNKNVLFLLNQLTISIEGGDSIWKAFEKIQLLPPHMLSVIRIGEEGGKLRENLNIVSTQLSKDRESLGKIKAATIYPSFILILTLVVGIIMTIFVLPQLLAVYKSLDIKLPATTQVLIEIQNFLVNYGDIFIPTSITTILILIYFIFFFSKTKHIGQSILFSMPIIKDILFDLEVSRFGYLLGSLIKSGYPISDALDLLEFSTGYKRYKDFYKHLKQDLTNGFSFSESYVRYKKINRVLPAYITQLTSSGERSGKLSDVLLQASLVYDKKASEAIKNLTVMAEPVLLVIVWLAVAFIAFATIMPIYSFVGNITNITNGSVIQNAK